MDIAFVNCNATKNMVDSFRGRLSPYNRVDKNGEPHLTGPGFAQAVAEHWGCPYVNDKAAFDICLERSDLGVRIGAEVKLKRNDPFRKGLHCELANGTATSWAFITKQTGKTGQQMTPEEMGNAYLDFCWDRWASYKVPVDLTHSIFVIGQIYELGENQVCKVFTVPLSAFPRSGELEWAFTPNTVVGRNASGHKLVEWYWKNNGLSKYYPLLDSVSFESEEFPTFAHELKTLHEWAKKLSYKPYLDKVKLAYSAGNIPFSLYKTAVQVAIQMYPDEHAMDILSTC